MEQLKSMERIETSQTEYGRFLVSMMWRVLIAILILTLCALLYACNYADPADIERWEYTAQHNAIEYTRQKYGFSAQVLGAKADYSGGGLGVRSISMVYVAMEQEGRQFTVYIDGEEMYTDGEQLTGWDTYQSKEIRAALLTDLLSHGLYVCKLELNAYTVTENHNEPDTLFSTYYTGDNLFDITREMLNGFSAFCINTDVFDTSAFDYVQDYFTESALFTVNIHNCRSFEHLSDNPLYCAETLMLKRYGNDQITAAITQNVLQEDSSGILLCATMKSNSVMQPRMTITPVDTPDMEQFVGHGFSKNAEAVSSAYKLTANGNFDVVVYFPQSMIENYTPPKIPAMTPYRFAFIYTNAEGERVGHEMPVHFDGYLRCKFSFFNASEYTFFIASID